jgi:predicted N-formylglutamate amidohydrolase
VRPWLFINGRSRLVIDPERFPDPEDEVMAAPEIGMGAVYTRTSHLRAMRADDPARDATLLETFFRPYAVALADLVAERLEATSSVTIIDLHSFPQVELPYERLVHPGAPRPACCIGTDEHHTPDVLAEMVGTAFARLGECRVNEPFVGTYVPLRFYKSDRRVSSVMVELRRDSYQHSRADLDAVEVMLTSLISDIQSRD